MKTKDDKVADVLEKKSVDNFLNFLAIYKDRSQKLSETLRTLNNETEAIDKELKVLNENLSKLRPTTEDYRTER